MQADWARFVSGFLGILPLSSFLCLLNSALPNVTQDDIRILLEESLRRPDLLVEKYLLEKYANHDYISTMSKRETLLRIALAQNREDSLKMISTHCSQLGFDWNQFTLFDTGKGPLIIFAAMKSYDVAVQWLLENGSDISQFRTVHRAPIEVCCRIATSCRAINTIKILLKHGADEKEFTTYSFRLLKSAITNGNIELVKYLVSKGANIHSRESNDESVYIPLLNCSTTPEMLKYLLNAGFKSQTEYFNLYLHAMRFHTISKKATLIDIFEKLWSLGYEINHKGINNYIEQCSVPANIAKWFEEKAKF